MAIRGRGPWRRWPRTFDQSDQRPVALAGSVAILRVTLHHEHPDIDREDRRGALRTLQERRGQIHKETQEAVFERLGSQFRVSAPEITEASIELLAFLSTAGEVMIAYGALRTGIDFLLGDFAKIIARHSPASSDYLLIPTLITGSAMRSLEALGAPLASEGLLLSHLMRLNLIMLSTLVAALLVAIVAALR